MGNTSPWMQAAAGAATSAIGIGINRLGANYDRKQQMKTQEQLIAQQMAAEKEMMDYQQLKELEMWEKTGYGAQVRQMKEAGLNSALMYGMRGGGGQTTGHGGSPSIAGGVAQHVNTTGMGIQNGIQMALMMSQKKVLDTQAEKNQAEADKTKGIDTEMAGMATEKLFQEKENLRQTHTLLQLEGTMRNIENFEKQATQHNRMDYIEYQTKTALRELNIVANENKISDATLQDKINIIKQEAIGAALKNVLTQSQTANVNSDTWLNTYRAKGIYNNILQGWEELSNENRELRIKEQLQEWTTDPNREAINQAVGAINSILHVNTGPRDSRTISNKEGNKTTITTRYEK